MRLECAGERTTYQRGRIWKIACIILQLSSFDQYFQPENE